jgi:parallel beta-helix repeat protein
VSSDPIAFLSYVRFDDQHEDGRLTQFRERLSGEVRLQTGKKFEIFQDRNAITWGEQWQQRIDESLDTVTFLIPILTPGFFNSPACRSEFGRFLERERKLGRRDLILPVYYVNCPILRDEARREADEIAKTVANRQWADWRELRFEPFTSPQVGKTLAKLAEQIVESLERGGHSRAVLTASAAAVAWSAAATTPSREEPAVQLTETTQRPSDKIEPPTRVVDALRGEYSNLTEALKHSKPGDRILVRPPIYRERIVIDNPVEIIGDGELGDVVIEAAGQSTVLFQATMARIANLSLRQTGEGDRFCIDIGQGRLDLEGCDLTSQGKACVAIHDGADPRLRRNRIHDGKWVGVMIYRNGQGTLEDNEIFAHALNGVQITSGGNPTLRRNRIHDGKGSGVVVAENGRGILEDNDIFANAHAGVAITSGGNPTARGNRIHDGKVAGILVSAKSNGTLEDNDIFANAGSGVEIREGSNPTLRRNRISQNGYHAIWVHDGGEGVFEDNDLRGNTEGAWLISPECEDKVTRNRNQE